MNTPLTLDDLLVDAAGKERGQIVSEIQDKLDSERAALVRNTGMTELSEMREWAQAVGLPDMNYEGGTGHRDSLGSGVLSVGTEPHYTNIEPHSEMCFWTFYPRYILFGCTEIPASGGDTVIADNRRVSEDIKNTPTGQRISARGIRYIRNFSDANRPQSIPSTKSWQEAFDISERAQLEDYCREKDWQLLQRDDGSVQVSYAEIGYEYDPKSDLNLLFTSMARLGRAFDDWPPYNELPNEQRPYHMTYADGEDFSAEDLAVLSDAFARYSVPLPWQPGDIAFLDNLAWPHARPPYELAPGERRRIGVLVSEQVERRRIVQPRCA